MSSVSIYVATHKRIALELPDYCKVIQVNAEENSPWEGYLHDNDGADNISSKNKSYCELTALYSLWKNSKADIVGLFHYRRFLSGESSYSLYNEANLTKYGKEIGKYIISENSIRKTLAENDVILAMPREPFPLNAFEDLQKFVYLDDIWKLIDLITKEYPEYKADFLQVLNSTNISYCNMFISKREFLDEYCEWLFAVLEKMENIIDIEGYDDNHKRIFGYYAEILLNVYILHHKKRVKTVYRVDLIESINQKQFIKNIIKRIINNVLVLLNIYPVCHSRAIFKARYRKGTNQLTEEINNLPKLNCDEAFAEARNFLSVTGSSNISEEENGYYSLIEGDYFSSKLSFYICSNCDSLKYTIKCALKKKEETVPFGCVNAIRIICCYPALIESQEKERLSRSGIIIQ